ncbi:class F sortase [Agrococcus sp. SGAir0287]|uniref:class F sortase n=1 Tax=Agrococcus sp. SGAir0287 TaxID=2070347 RepID=UPI0010CD1ED2|nr:class F sortase [Agrococcus sp. SGAir0287]QCR18084.1 class F sortase [Agrococcus sp. SGAir0287]
MPKPRTARRAAIVAGVTAVALAVVGGVWLATGDRFEVQDSTASPAPSPTASPSPTPTPTPSPSAPPSIDRTDAGIGAQQPPAQDVPVEVRVEDVGLDLPIIPVGVRADGQMDVPLYVSEVGWYEYGPAPGATEGSAVLSAHVDSELGAAPMAALFDVQPGALVEVTTASGAVLQFRVEQVEQLGKAQLPLDELFARDGPPVLRLVTCAGEFDPVAGAYEDNLIVTATPVGA